MILKFDGWPIFYNIDVWFYEEWKLIWFVIYSDDLWVSQYVINVIEKKLREVKNYEIWIPHMKNHIVKLNIV